MNFEEAKRIAYDERGYGVQVYMKPAVREAYMKYAQEQGISFSQLVREGLEQRCGFSAPEK